MCKMEFWVTSKQAQTRGYKLVCCRTITLDTIKTAKVSISFVPTGQDIVKDAYRSLKEFGYEKESIKQFQDAIEATTVEELVKKFLKVQKCST
jgi:uncharacterized protein (UPF0297 family)